MGDDGSERLNPRDNMTRDPETSAPLVTSLATYALSCHLAMVQNRTMEECPQTRQVWGIINRESFKRC